jgi:hypothetical protein
MPRLTPFVPKHAFLKQRQRERMRDLRYQRQLQFASRFPVRFPRKNRAPSVPVKAPPTRWLDIFREKYGFFPMFKKLPNVNPFNLRLLGWRFYRDRFAWGRDFIDLVRDFQAYERRVSRYR